MVQGSIKPYHLFQRKGCWHVINIEAMSGWAIDEITAKTLEKHVSEQAMPLTPQIKEQLRKMELYVENNTKSANAKKESKAVPYPVVNMSLFITQSCNLNCVYCYGNGGGYGTGGNMEQKTAFKAVDWQIEQSGKIKKLHIGFFGGEPFLNFSLMKAIVEYAEKKVQERGKEVCFHTTTNATLLDDEKIAYIKEHNISALISFDGPKEIHNAQRPYANGEGSYDTLAPKIKKLLAVVPNTPGHAVLVGNTDPEIVKNALMEIGFSQVTIMPASQSLFSNEQGKTRPERAERILQAMEEETETWLRLTKSRDNEALKVLKIKSGLYLALQSLLHNSKRRYACGAGLGLAAVSVVGDIYLCHRFVGQDKYKLGNVFRKHLNREEYQKSPVTGDGVCAACFARYYCAGGCKHDNAGVNGSVTKPAEDLCRLRCREFELAAVIVSQLDTEDRAFLIDNEIFDPKPCPLDF